MLTADFTGHHNVREPLSGDIGDTGDDFQWPLKVNSHYKRHRGQYVESSYES